VCPSIKSQGLWPLGSPRMLLQRTCKKGAAASTPDCPGRPCDANPRPTRTGTWDRWTCLTILKLTILLWDAVYALETCTGRGTFSSNVICHDAGAGIGVADDHGNVVFACQQKVGSAPRKLGEIADQGRNTTASK
jgi:hypothetical protein